MNCTIKNCTCETYLHLISKLYYDVVETLFNAAETYIVHKEKLKKFPKVVPGWSSVTKQKHAIASSYYVTWVTKEKPTNGDLFDAMKISKIAFKKAVKYCKSKSEQHKADAIAEALHEEC